MGIKCPSADGVAEADSASLNTSIIHLLRQDAPEASTSKTGRRYRRRLLDGSSNAQSSTQGIPAKKQSDSMVLLKGQCKS